MFEHTAMKTLSEEIDRYLAVVDLFRAEGCEPAWRAEVVRGPVSSSPAPAPDRLPSDIRLH